MIVRRKKLRDLIAAELADMTETDPVTRGLIARPARSVARDEVQELLDLHGVPFRVPPPARTPDMDDPGTCLKEEK